MPDKRLIDANAMLEAHRCRLAQNAIKVENGAMAKLYSKFEAAIMEWLAEYLSSATTIDAVPVVHARWRINKQFGDYECSACGQGDIISPYFKRLKLNYCPNCGAKMDGGEPHEENPNTL